MKTMKTILFMPRRSMGITKLILFGDHKGFILAEYILEAGKFEKYSSYISNNIQDIQNEIEWNKTT